MEPWAVIQEFYMYYVAPQHNQMFYFYRDNAFMRTK